MEGKNALQLDKVASEQCVVEFNKIVEKLTTLKNRFPDTSAMVDEITKDFQTINVSWYFLAKQVAKKADDVEVISMQNDEAQARDMAAAIGQIEKLQISRANQDAISKLTQKEIDRFFSFDNTNASCRQQLEFFLTKHHGISKDRLTTRMRTLTSSLQVVFFVFSQRLF